MVSICPSIRNVNLDHLFKLSARFLHCQTTIFPFVTDFGEVYVETMEISCFSYLLINFSMHQWFIIPSIFVSRRSNVRQSFPFYSFIYLIIYLFIPLWTLRFLFYSLCFNQISSSFILIFKLSRCGLWGTLQVGFCVFLTYPQHSLSTSLSFCTEKCPSLILYFCSPSSGISHFFKEFCIFFMENDI